LTASGAFRVSRPNEALQQWAGEGGADAGRVSCSRGRAVFDPSPAQLAEILHTTGPDYWLQGGNGEATLDVAREPGEPVASHRALTTADGVTVEYATGQPSLWIKQPEPGWYFITWSPAGGEELVPYDGSSIEPFVVEERGGEPFRVPRACLVPPHTAVEIVREYLVSRRRSGAVQWRPWFEVELPLPAEEA
jgi:hypothetical protein